MVFLLLLLLLVVVVVDDDDDVCCSLGGGVPFDVSFLSFFLFSARDGAKEFLRRISLSSSSNVLLFG